jgi:hypothetical protein
MEEYALKHTLDETQQAKLDAKRDQHMWSRHLVLDFLKTHEELPEDDLVGFCDARGLDYRSTKDVLRRLRVTKDVDYCIVKNPITGRWIHWYGKCEPGKGSTFKYEERKDDEESARRNASRNTQRGKGGIVRERVFDAVEVPDDIHLEF